MGAWLLLVATTRHPCSSTVLYRCRNGGYSDLVSRVGAMGASRVALASSTAVSSSTSTSFTFTTASADAATAPHAIQEECFDVNIATTDSQNRVHMDLGFSSRAAIMFWVYKIMRWPQLNLHQND